MTTVIILLLIHCAVFVSAVCFAYQAVIADQAKTIKALQKTIADHTADSPDWQKLFEEIQL